MKQCFFGLALTILIASCDVRRKDYIADEAGEKKEQSQKINAAANAQALKDTTSVEIIDSSYNFGKITSGEKVEYNFRFKNVGQKPLVIINATASCGCTVPEKPEAPIMPGEIGHIKVVFNSAGKSGHQEKSIVVSSNANPGFPNLYIRGEVEATKE